VTALARVGCREGDFVKENEATKNANQLRPVSSEGDPAVASVGLFTRER
jgi:hypothetical protein